MKINELKTGEPFRDIEVSVKEIEEIINYGSGEKAGRILPLIVEDQTGSVKLKLFNEQINKCRDKLKTGTKLMLKRGMTRSYDGKLEISTGKYDNDLVLLD